MRQTLAAACTATTSILSSWPRRRHPRQAEVGGDQKRSAIDFERIATWLALLRLFDRSRLGPFIPDARKENDVGRTTGVDRPGVHRQRLGSSRSAPEFHDCRHAWPPKTRSSLRACGSARHEARQPPRYDTVQKRLRRRCVAAARISACIDYRCGALTECKSSSVARGSNRRYGSNSSPRKLRPSRSSISTIQRSLSKLVSRFSSVSASASGTKPRSKRDTQRRS